ncbi:hypothetical protein CHUAL_002768 [Chamberlinius hualienensis]
MKSTFIRVFLMFHLVINIIAHPKDNRLTRNWEKTVGKLSQTWVTTTNPAFSYRKMERNQDIQAHRNRSMKCRYIFREEDECSTTCYTRRLSTCKILINYSWRPHAWLKYRNSTEDIDARYRGYPSPPCDVLVDCSTLIPGYTKPSPYPDPPLGTRHTIQPPYNLMYSRLPNMARICNPPFYVTNSVLQRPPPPIHPTYASYCNCTEKDYFEFISPFYSTTCYFDPATLCPEGFVPSPLPNQ